MSIETAGVPNLSSQIPQARGTKGSLCGRRRGHAGNRKDRRDGIAALRAQTGGRDQTEKCFDLPGHSDH